MYGTNEHMDKSLRNYRVIKILEALVSNQLTELKREIVDHLPPQGHSHCTRSTITDAI